MTHPTPHQGHATQSADFGATTVSGTPGGNPADARGVPLGHVAGPVMPPSFDPPPGPKQGDRASDHAPKPTPGKSAPKVRGPRRARLQLRHVNPWTVLKFSCVLSIALFFVWLIVVGILFGVLDASGVIQKINDTVTTINGPGSNPPVSAGIVFGAAAIVGVVNVVLFIALTTVGSVIYNLCADLVGGVELTLSEA